MLKSLTCSVVFLTAAAPSFGQLIANDTEGSRLIALDPSTGAANPFQTHTIPGNVVGLTYQASSGTLFGISNGPSNAFNGIYTFDLEDGSAALAPITQANPHPINVVSALAAHPTDNVLYALQTGSPTRSALWSIDLDTGTYTQLTVDLDPFMTALTFTSDGTLIAGSANFFTNQGTLYKVDLDTVTTSEIATSSDLLMTGLAADPISGNLYGVYNGFGSIDTLFEIDASNGLTTDIATFDLGNLNAVAFIPAPGISMAFLTAGGLIARRRNRA